MKSKKLILFFYLLNLSIMPNSLPENGSWLSEIKEFRDGKEFLQFNVQGKNFIFAKLSFNKVRNWEELRVIGTIEMNKAGEIQIKPEMCTVFATNKLGRRWILIKGFDCDHLEFKITKTEQELTICPSIGISENITLKNENNFGKNTMAAVIVSSEEKTFHAWSLGFRRIRKNSEAIARGKKIKILETVDSTGSFESGEPIQIGDRIQLNNRGQAGLFD